MFFLLFGADSFRARKKLATMREQFALKRDATGLNATHLRAREVSLEEVGAAIFASPFLAERKLVVMEGFLSAPAAMQEGVAEMLGRKPESSNVIFFEDGGSEDFAKSALLPVLKAQKFTEEFMPLAGAALEAFAVAECAARGVTLGPREARVLVGVVGSDSWLLHEEISKLCAYALGSSGAAGAGSAGAAAVVTPEMLETVTPGAREESVFALIDACVEGRGAAAALQLERMLEAGTSELQILTLLQKQYRTLIAVGDLVMRGERDKNAVARRVGIHAFPAQKAMAFLGGGARPGFSPAELRARYDELLEIERQIKTSAARPNALLGLWLARGEVAGAARV